MSGPFRMSKHNRIKEHRQVRAGDLVPHPLNPRTHPGQQKEALQALYKEVGFARSLLAYELPDGRLQLIDGHLRRSIDPDLVVTVEVLDVTEEEAHILLLSLDPMAALAGFDGAVLDQLRQQADSDSDVLQSFWAGIQASEPAVLPESEPEGDDQGGEGDGGGSGGQRPGSKDIEERFHVIVECDDEAHQAELLERFKRQGWSVKALLS